MSSQDKAGPQDGTEDAATEGRRPDTAETLPEAPQDADAQGGAGIEDAEVVTDPDGSEVEVAAQGATDETADDAAEIVAAGGDDPADTPTDDAMDDADTVGDPDAVAHDAPNDEPESAEDRTGPAAAALAGTAAGAALGAGAGSADAQRDDPAATVAPASQKSGGGFVPAFLGGVVAAAIGVGGVLYFGGALPGGDDGLDQALEQGLSAQDDRLAALDAKLDTLSDAVAARDDTGAGDRIAALGDSLTDQLGGVADRIDAMAGRLEDLQGGLASLDTRLADVNDRLTAVERRPLTESSEAAQAAFAAYEDDISELRAALEEQTQANEALAAQLDERAAAAQAEVEAAAARAADLQAQAEEQTRIATEQAEARARAAAVREALVGLDAALEKGTSFESYLQVLSEGAEVPQVLSAAAADGVTPMPDLRDAFPDLARDALDASIRETVDDELTDRAVAFLKAQTGFRSLAPREGDDPDAVLSRAEAALREYDLGTAVSELSQLPPAGQAVMADWIARAEERRAVTEAAETLAANLLAN